MERFYGFDLGDAESAVSRLQKKEQSVPEIIPVCGSSLSGKTHFIYSLLTDIIEENTSQKPCIMTIESIAKSTWEGGEERCLSRFGERSS